MSFFAVTVRHIKRTWPIEGANAIELAEVEGFTWQFVVGKDAFKPGDIVAYFPLDALIPVPVLEALGMVGKFSGKDCNRVKTREFRGQKSQGYVCSLATIVNFIPESTQVGDDITTALGVTKYEPPEIAELGGNLLPLPPICHGKYDIEGCDNFPDVTNFMMDKKIAAFEKLEGKNFSSGIDSMSEGKLFISQRNFTIQPIDGSNHDFWKVAREQGIIDATNSLHRRFGGDVLIRGEFIGPGSCGNIYKLAKKEIRIFDIMLDNKYVDVIQFLELCAEYGLTTCPLIAKDITLREYLAGRTIDQAATGKSALADVLKEGEVYRLMKEEHNPWTGRTIIKQRSALYLSKQKEA